MQFIKIFIGHELLFILIFSHKQYLLCIKIEHKRIIESRKGRFTSPQKLLQLILCVWFLDVANPGAHFRFY